MVYTHQCIKCKSSYQDEDPDVYLCETCTKAKLEIAAKIDAEFAMRSRMEPMSELKQHEMNGQTVNVNGRNVTFARA